MLQFLIAFIVSAFIMGSAWSSCIEVPYLTEDKACYDVSSSLQITAPKDEENYIELTLSPFEVEFKNIPDKKSYHYLYVEHDSDRKPINLYVASFQCHGEIPITADARIKSLDKKSRGLLGIFISTGEAAADRYLVPSNKRIRAEVFDQFINVFEERTSTEELENFNVFIPTIINNMSQDTFSEQHRKIISWFFEESSSSLNGCSERFIKTMKDHELEELTKNPFIHNIQVIKESADYKIQIKKAP